MLDAAWTPPFARTDSRPSLPPTALALLAGIGACLLLPRLPAWPLLAVLLLLGGWIWWRGGRMALLGVFLAGCGFAGLHASHALARQQPPAMEGRMATVHGRVLELPQPDPRGTRFQFRVDDAADLPSALRGRRLQLAWYDDRAHYRATGTPAVAGSSPSNCARPGG